MMPPPAIDCHAHIFHRGMPFKADAWIRPDYDYRLEAYLADLDRHGIGLGVITAASLYGTYNDYTLDALRSQPRLRGTVMLDKSTGADELRVLRESGVVGVRMQWKIDAVLPDFEDPDHAAFLDRLADNGLHAELNCSADQLAILLPILRERPIDVVIDHFGLLRAPEGLAGNGFAETLRSLAAGRTWVKISAGFRLAPALRQAAFARLWEESGPDRLLWGSDAPFVGHEDGVSYAETIAMFEAMVPDARHRDTIGKAGVGLYFS